MAKVCKLKIVPTDKTIDSLIVMRIEDVNSKFNEVEFNYDGIQFAEKENDDGSLTLTFGYQIVSGVVADHDLEEFKSLIGDNLIDAIERQIESNSVVYKGGVDDGAIIVD